MPIENRSLPAGTRLLARYKGQQHSAEVAQTEDGVRYRLEDGREFTSLSAAGSALMAGKACNGWRFWSLAGEETAKQPGKTSKRRKDGGSGLFSRLEDGRFFCSACQDAFSAPEGIEPERCPQGHREDASA